MVSGLNLILITSKFDRLTSGMLLADFCKISCDINLLHGQLKFFAVVLENYFIRVSCVTLVALKISRGFSFGHLDKVAFIKQKNIKIQ